MFAILVPSDAPAPFPLLRWLVPALVLVYAVVAIGIRPWIRFRVHRWEVTGEAVYTLTGWLTRHFGERKLFMWSTLAFVFAYAIQRRQRLHDAPLQDAPSTNV